MMKIGNREISEKHRPLIIAEIGINHGGNLKLAKEMVLQASKSGCECIKHQTHIVEDEMTEEAKSIFPPNADISIWDIMKKCSLSLDEEVELKKYTEELGLIYLSTPFSRKAVDFLCEQNVLAFKIGSGECDNLPLIKHIVEKNKPIIMSTGMQSIESIKKSINIIENAKLDYALLECTNLYPSSPEFVSLKGILELKKNFPKSVVGFSDHSIGPYMAIAAVALGALIIERHFTDTRYRKGPDIICSMDPAELKILIERSNEIFIAKNNEKYRTKPEEDVYKFARASIVSDADLEIGHQITYKDIWARRPGNGEIAAYEFDNILGKILKKTVKKNQQLRWSDFED